MTLEHKKDVEHLHIGFWEKHKEKFIFILKEVVET